MCWRQRVGKSRSFLKKEIWHFNSNVKFLLSYFWHMQHFYNLLYHSYLVVLRNDTMCLENAYYHPFNYTSGYLQLIHRKLCLNKEPNLNMRLHEMEKKYIFLKALPWSNSPSWAAGVRRLLLRVHNFMFRDELKPQHIGMLVYSPHFFLTFPTVKAL